MGEGSNRVKDEWIVWLKWQISLVLWAYDPRTSCEQATGTVKKLKKNYILISYFQGKSFGTFLIRRSPRNPSDDYVLSVAETGKIANYIIHKEQDHYKIGDQIFSDVPQVSFFSFLLVAKYRIQWCANDWCILPVYLWYTTVLISIDCKVTVAANGHFSYWNIIGWIIWIQQC